MKLLVTVLLFVTLNVFVLADEPPSSPISCYVCNELEDKECKDPFKSPEKFLTKCENGEQYCRKIVQTGRQKIDIFLKFISNINNL